MPFGSTRNPQSVKVTVWGAAPVWFSCLAMRSPKPSVNLPLFSELNLLLLSYPVASCMPIIIQIYWLTSIKAHTETWTEIPNSYGNYHSSLCCCWECNLLPFCQGCKRSAQPRQARRCDWTVSLAWAGLLILSRFVIGETSMPIIPCFCTIFFTFFAEKWNFFFFFSK